MVFCTILPSEVEIQEFNPPEHYLSSFSQEQGGQHLLPKKKEVEKRKRNLFWRTGLACDNPNPLLERW